MSSEAERRDTTTNESTDLTEGIAIVGMAGRFPGASNVGELWENLAGGVESIRFFSEEELLESGVDPALLSKPGYIPATGYLEGADLFDANFFGFSAREAEILDPQHRLFLEQSWVALESAGYDSATYDGAIGIFGGMNASSYLINNLLKNRRVRNEASVVELRIRTDKDFLASLVAYKLGLTGPSLTVQTACSTSLVAVSLACQSLMTYQCDMALAGGVSTDSPQKCGILAHGEWTHADGHCRAFDARAGGPTGGQGVGVVVLKRLADALAEGDSIRAVIRGFAVNNDGALKAGFTAPSQQGQAQVIAMAQAMAGVEPETIGFIEGHGTGTPLGDPIEVEALTQVFGESTEKRGFCALGSIKTNIGHVDAAAGVASLIKTVLALEHGQVPPSLNFEEPNPAIDFDNTPFFVNSELIDWPRRGGRRRAGVSSFAAGGVNAHLVLEEAPHREPADPGTSPELLVLSAKTEAALEAATDRLAEHLGQRPELDLRDVAYTLQVGRRAFNWRRALVCNDREDALAALAGRDPKRLLTGNRARRRRPTFFLFPGLGEQQEDMALSLYQEEPVFRREVDRCCEILESHLGCDLRTVLFPRGTEAPVERAAGGPGDGGIDLRRLMASRSRAPSAEREIDQTRLAQPAVFVIEHALAQLWLELGVVPQGLAGFSLGEYTAACLAGVFSLEDALRLVALRARLISELPHGAMLAVSLPEEEARELLRPSLSLAAASSAESAVIAGPADEVDEVERELAERGVSAMRLNTSHAFHSRMMEPARVAFVEALRQIELQAPRIPFLSNVSGTWITADQATDPEYWGSHMVGTVRFADNLDEMGKESGAVLLEVGPGRSLSAWALQHPRQEEGDGALVVPSLGHGEDPRPDRERLLETLGRLWLAGLEVSWDHLHDGAARRRVELPSYPFERQRFWIEPDLRESTVPSADGARPAREEEPEAPASEEPPGAPGLHRRPHLDNPYVEPESELEQRVAGVWEEILGIARIGAHDNYFDLGGDSMRAPQLLLKLHAATGAELTLKSLFQAPTVADMAKMIEGSEGGATAAAAPLDLEQESALDPAVLPEGEVVADVGRPQAVFLTGATGFLGAFLLADLLAQTDADVFCLVRADSPASGHERIRQNLKLYGVWDEALADRVVAVPGDFGEPLLGIPAEEFDRLAARVDAIYHCGAWINSTYDYQVLKPANVLGTQEALRLAGRKKTKPFHYLSTLVVFSRYSCSEEGIAFEDTVLSIDDPSISGDPSLSSSEHYTGYIRSKWVAEKLVDRAQERGIPTTIIRLPIIGGDSRSGLGNRHDLVWNFLKGCVQLGAYFKMTEMLSIAPVDYVSRAILHISHRPESLGRRFHLPNPESRTWEDLFVALRDMGYSVELLPYDQWHERLMRQVRSAGDQALIPFLPLVPSVETMKAYESAKTVSLAPEGFDDTNARRALEGSGLQCPPITTEMVQKYVSSFVERGLFPAPPRETENMNADSAEPSATDAVLVAD